MTLAFDGVILFCGLPRDSTSAGTFAQFMRKPSFAATRIGKYRRINAAIPEVIDHD